MILKNLLFTLALLVSFSLFGQIQTEEFKMGYKKGYQDGYLKSKGTSYNGVIDFSKVRTGIEITDFLMGDKYDDTEKIYDTLLNIYNISEEKDISTSKASSQLAMQIIAEKNESKFIEFNYDK